MADIMRDTEGRLWVSTSRGLNRVDPANPGVFEHFLLPEDGSDGSNAAVARKFDFDTSFERPTEPGVIWAASMTGLFRLDPKSGSHKYYPYPTGQATRSLGSRIQIVNDPVNRNVLWMNIYSQGLLRFDIRYEQFVQYKANPDDPNSLQSDRVLTLFGDRSGTIWAGSFGHGVDRFTPAASGVQLMRAGSQPNRGLPSPLVWGVTETPDGMLWVATMDESGKAALSRIDRSTGLARHFRHDPNDPHSIPTGSVLQVMTDRNGTLWVGGTGPVPLARFESATGSFRQFRYDPSDSGGLPSRSVGAMHMDRGGALWIGSADGKGLIRLDVTSNIFETFPLDIKAAIWAISEDRSGTLWLGTSGVGLVRFDPVTGQTQRFVHDVNDTTSIASDNIQAILQRSSDQDVVWVGTDHGISRLDVSTGLFTHFDRSDGMPDNTVYTMLEDAAGRIWMSTNRGLSRFTPETGEFRNYGMEVGLQALEFAQWGAYKSPSGEMFFGGINGLNAFFPNDLTGNSTPPEVALVDLKLNNVSIAKSGLRLDEPVPAIDRLVLDHTQKDLTFDFAALHFENPEKNQFAYKLEGYDSDWVMIGQGHTASFTNLSPGDYIFHVKAANSDGVWNEEGTSVAIVITPPFWATWWFRLLALIGFSGLLYAGYALRVRQIADRSRMLEAEVGKRTAELNESKDRLELTNEQLEQSHTIVQAINQETSFRRLLTKILEEARVIRGVEKATALIRMEDDLFHVRASSGWDVSQMQHIRLTRKQAHERYVEQASELAENIFVAKNVGERAGTEEMAEFGHVASFLVLRIVVEGDVTAYLVFDNLTDPDAFDQRDVSLLERLREHIQSAFTKTRILEDLQHTLDDLRSTQDRLIQSEKMASLGQLTAGIAHEIKNPLNFVNNFSDVTTELATELTEEMERLKKKLPAEDLAELASIVDNLSLNAKKIGEHGKRADAIVKNMLEHSKVGEGERSSTDLNELLDEYVTLARHGLEARGGGFEVVVERSYDDTVGRVDVVPQDMGRVFMNLIGNAFDALKEHGSRGGAPTVSVSTAKIDGMVEIRFKDNGPGIPPKVMVRIFEPFFTTKPTGSGTGLGLSMAYDIVTKGHAGTLDVESEEGEGATFVVRLPV